MESKSYVLALIILAAAGLGDCAAVDRELRKINFKINNMQQDIAKMYNMQQDIAELKFENRELRNELEGEKNRTGQLEIQLRSALSRGTPAITDNGIIDSTVEAKLPKMEGVIDLLASDVDHLKSMSYTNMKAFVKEKAAMRKLNETIRNKQEVATREINKFIAKSNVSLERLSKDIGNLYNTTTEHEEAMKEMTTKLDQISSAMGNADVRISQTESLVTALSGDYSNLKKEDIETLHSTTSDHEEALLEMTAKLDDITSTMGNTDIRISQNERLLTVLSDCGSHKEIPNGHVSGDSSYGGTPVISCNSGYSMTGSAQCKIPAAWETDAKCQKDCAVLHIAHGMVSPATSVSHGTTVTVTCDRGYVVVANNTTVCNNGDFTAVPSCRRGYFTEMTVGSSSSFNIKFGDDGRTPWISGAEFLSDGRLSICDYQNSRLKLLSSDFTVINSLKLSSSPWDVSAVNSTTVVVTLPKLLQYVHVLPHFQLGSKIRLDKDCYGIDVVGD